ncbi:unnamed protein product, partial [Musa banksii]
MPTPILFSCFFPIVCVFLSLCQGFTVSTCSSLVCIIFQWSSHSCVTLLGNVEGDAVMALSDFDYPSTSIFICLMDP